MCKGNNTTTNTSAPNPQAMSAYQSVLGQAQGVANTPFQQYGGEFVAPVNAQQNLGISNINAAQPVFGQALTMAQNAAQPITQQQIQQYMSPYTQNVVDATKNQFNNQNAQGQQQVLGNAAAQGALGGNRVGIAQAELANQQQLAQAPVIAGLENQGYTTGLNTALTEQQAAAQGAYGVANMGTGMLGAAGAQVGAGSLQQQTQQAQDAALYNQFMMQQAYPFQTTQWLSGIDTGVGSQMGGTSTSTPPPPNMASQIFGGLAGAGGMLGASGAFGAAGWLAPAMAMMNRGGGVAGYAEGGGVAEPYTMPEGPDTLNAQQDQLEAGDRPAQMFPNGAPELPLPDGMKRTNTANGVFHYDPDQTDPKQISDLSGQGRENELLNLGPFTKQDIMQRLQMGEQPVAIVERTPDGTEVRAAVGTTKTAPIQIQVMERTKSPGNRVGLEDPRAIISDRMGSNGMVPGSQVGPAPGGLVPGRAPGGQIGGVPYSGVGGYVPSMNITQGRGAPGAPQPPGAPQSDPTKQMKGITDLASGIHGIFGNMDADPGSASNPLPGLTADDYSESRGGRVPHYADGGAPEGAYDEFGPTYYTATNPPPPPEAKPEGVAPPVDQDSSVGVAPPTGGIGSDAARTPDVDQPVWNASVSTIAPQQASLAQPASTPPPEGVADPGSGPEGGLGAPPVMGGLPRGLRNNNPGNIEDGSFARSQPGYVGSDGRFAKFASPGAGQNAASNLLVSYSDKGINTIDGIVKRWAPASDGNNTSAYIDSVSKKTGFAPGQPLDLNDPSVRAKVSAAIFGVENGTGAPKGGPNPGGGVSPDGVVPAKQSGPDFSENSKLWPALMSAGFGMMASRSPFFGQAVGEGGLAGMQTYEARRQQESTQGMNQQRINLEAKKLAQAADVAEKRFGLEHQRMMLPYSGALTTHDQQQLAIERAKLEELRNQHELALRKPETVYDQKGIPHTMFPRPGLKGGVDWWEYDAATHQMIPPGGGLNAPHGNQQPGPGGGPQPQSGFQAAAFKPSEPGNVWKTNGELVEQANQQGGVDYADPEQVPSLQKGMEAPEPQPVGNHTSDSIKTSAEKWFETGALPKAPMGNSPVARIQQRYASAVENYGNALARSRGFTPQQIIDQQRSAPGMLRFVLGADGRSTVSLGTAVRHLDTLAEYAKAWHAGDEQTLNRVKAAFSREFGGTAATNLETVARIVGPEILKAIGVAGAGTSEDRAGITNQFTTARSYDQVMGAVMATQKLMGGQLEGKERQARNAGVTHEKFMDLIGDRPYKILNDLDHGKSVLTRPSVDQFITAAKKANPGMSDSQLKEIYKKKYGE